jgi:hypothetical protein
LRAPSLLGLAAWRPRSCLFAHNAQQLNAHHLLTALFAAGLGRVALARSRQGRIARVHTTVAAFLYVCIDHPVAVRLAELLMLLCQSDSRAWIEQLNCRHVRCTMLPLFARCSETILLYLSHENNCWLLCIFQVKTYEHSTDAEA